MKKKIIVACGGGIATSTLIVSRLKEILKQSNINADITQCRVSEIDSYKDNANLIISSANLKKNYGVPSLQALSFISGIGMDETVDKIVEILRRD